MNARVFELRKSIAFSRPAETKSYSTVELRQVGSQTIFHVAGLMKSRWLIATVLA